MVEKPTKPPAMPSDVLVSACDRLEVRRHGFAVLVLLGLAVERRRSRNRWSRCSPFLPVALTVNPLAMPFTFDAVTATEEYWATDSRPDSLISPSTLSPAGANGVAPVRRSR